MKTLLFILLLAVTVSAQQHSAIIPFTSADDLMARVDSVLKANVYLDTVDVWQKECLLGVRPFVKYASAQLICVVIAEPIAGYDSLGVTPPKGAVNYSTDGKILSWEQDYYSVKQPNGSLLWGHRGRAGWAVVWWKD